MLVCIGQGNLKVPDGPRLHRNSRWNSIGFHSRNIKICAIPNRVGGLGGHLAGSVPVEMIEAFVATFAHGRRGHRNARWIGAASHRQKYSSAADEMTSVRFRRHLYLTYEREQADASISYAVTRIFGTIAREMSWWRRSKMVHLLAGDDKYRDLPYDDDYRSYLVTRRNSLGEYRFGRTHGKSVRGHAGSALGRFKGYFKNMIEAIANSKMRRMERELQLHGIRYDRSSNEWMAGHPDRAGVREN